ncbi:sugar phosphate isomerase/epimerase family protein [Rariglobus hedericola]|nr:sugar phosphate isomerase/epimerase [Rariglobus hedericola]
MVKPSLALSTCWNSFRHTDGYAMLREIADLGFTHAELSHGIRIVLLPGVIRAVEEGVIKISSTHNFCPLPTGITQSAPNLFEPSVKDHREHEQWLRHTKRSLDFAAQMKSRVLVMHLGSVKFLWFNPAGKLKAFVRNNPTVTVPDDKAYRAVLKKGCEKLRLKMGPYWQQVQASIEEVRGYAVERGVKLGFENREKFEELPLDDDFDSLIGGLAQPHTAGYWHDTGHADIKQSMGMLEHRLHLEKNAPRLLGFHLHDVTADGKDHQPIGAGRIDFNMISSFWRPEHLLTLELSPRVKTEDIVESKQRIEALIEARFGA